MALKSLRLGVSLSGTITTPRFDGRDKFLFQLDYGNGIGRYVNDLNSIGNYDGIFNTETGDLQLFTVFAGYGSCNTGGALHCAPTPLWLVEINNPGFVPGTPTNEPCEPANLLWNPTPQVDTGLSTSGHSRKQSGDHGEAQRCRQ